MDMCYLGNLLKLFKRRIIQLIALMSFVFVQASGVLMLCIGIWMRIQLRDYMNMNVQGSGAALLALACLGAVLAVAAVLACCCTARGHPALLYLVNKTICNLDVGYNTIYIICDKILL